MGLVNDYDLKGSSAEHTSKSSCNIIGKNVNAALGVELILSARKNLDIFFMQEGQPIHIFISPVEAQ